MATNPSLIGQLIAGRYRIEQRRGTGAHGIVLDAFDEQLQRAVAVKILLPQFANDTASEARFRLEAQVAASFTHPNLNSVFDWGVEEIEGVKVPFLVIENLTGGSLRDMIDRGRLLTPSQALVVGLDACRGLDAMHRQGVIHRDLRPANLAFGDDRHAQILDVGLSRYVAETTWAEPSAAGIDAARYASPEQARGATPADGSLTSATDIYSLCLVLIECVTGQVPFVSDSTVATLNARIDKLMPVSADFGPLASVLSRAGSASAADRYTAAEFGRALVQAAGKLPRPAPLDVVGSGLFGDTTGGTRRPIDPTTESGTPLEPGADPGELPTAAVVASGLPAPAPPTEAITVTSLDPAPVPMTVGGGPSVSAPVAAAPSLVALVTSAAAPAAPSTPPVIVRYDSQTGELLVPPPPVDPAPATAVIDLGTATAPMDRPFDFTVDDDEAVAASPRRKRKGLWIVVALVAIAALAAGALVIYSLVKDTSHTVPELAGVPEAVGRNQVAENGWKVVVTTERNDAQAAGNIIRTDPAAGVKLEEGKQITFVVSEGATLSALPDVTGQTLDAATALLAASHLSIEVGSTVYDEQVPEGAIISWTVPAQPGLTAGAQVMQATVVSVVVSQGPEPRVVPSLIGLDEATATATLTDLQLVYARGVDVFSDDQPAGLVAEQSLPIGSAIQRGETITVAISMGPQLVAVPALGGLSYPEIEAALTAAGLKVGKITGDKDLGTIQDATVDGVPLVPGQQIHIDTAVDLQFSVPPPPTTDTVPVSSVQP